MTHGECMNHCTDSCTSLQARVHQVVVTSHCHDYFRLASQWGGNSERSKGCGDLYLAHETMFHSTTDFTWILMLQKGFLLTKLPSCSPKALWTGTWAQSMAPVTQGNPLKELESNNSQMQLDTHHGLQFCGTLLSLLERENALETVQTLSVSIANGTANNILVQIFSTHHWMHGGARAREVQLLCTLFVLLLGASVCGITHTYGCRSLCM